MPNHLRYKTIFLIPLIFAGAFFRCSSAFAQIEPATKNSTDETKNNEELNKVNPKKIATPLTTKASEAPAKSEVQKVTIKGGRQSDLDERRLSTASRMIFGREELDRNGDSNIGDVLKRLPGVTIGGRPGRGGDIRMRGMGSGYTQILINGERAPRGFSMDSLSPDQVERIEVMRGPVAEYSTQAIAGTINIVLREDYKQKDVELKLSESFEQGRSAPTISLTYPGQFGSLSYALSGSIFRNRQHDQSAAHIEDGDGQGQLNFVQDLHDETNRQTSGIHFTPRFNFRFENGDTLMLQPFIMNSRSDSLTNSLLVQTPGATARYASANSTGNSDSNFARGFGNWQSKFSNNAKLNIKFGGGLGRMDSASLRTQFDAGGNLKDTISDVNNTRDSNINIGSKYTVSLGEMHTLAAGLDIEKGSRSQTRTSLDNGVPQFADSGDNLNASTRRLAVFVQDEFDINPQWSAYAGLRWEGIRTDSTTSDNAVDNSSAVWSPILHAVWRLPGGSKDQVRMGLTSSYRAPTLSDLIALPSISQLNGPTRPDRSGNPLLKPERAKGIDLAFEHYLTRAGIMSVNVFVRSIDALIRRRTEQVITSTGLRWVSSPVNIGHAMTRGIELEAKFQLQEFFPDAAAIDFRSNYSHFWSRVDDIRGPNNRLDQQPNQTANVGLDYRPKTLPLTLGGSVNWTPAYVAQVSDTQVNFSGIKRQIDLYGLWKFNPALQLRLSANNLQAEDAW
ncbi:MAG: TonB-dependent receptor, partial [Undibacterium sp.]|nr:TonB-dependent receptor [Undibacterium sp.]